MKTRAIDRALALLLITLATALASGSPARAAPPLVLDLADRVEKTLPGVVNVASTTVTRTRGFAMDNYLNLWGIPQERKQSSLGSGFIVDNDGYVMTNYHVIEDADEVLVTLLDKRQFKAKVVGTDEKMDIALLQIKDANGRVPGSLQPVKFGDSEKIRIGDSVFAVGNPMGLQHTVTVGIISAKHRTIGQGPFDNFLQTDAAINPGNSGGPLFGLDGQLVGINTVIYSRTGQSGGLGFAIPVNEATKNLAELKKLGRVPRPWLGVMSERMTPAIAAYYRLRATEGVLVYNLVARGPADRAGLRQGDVILEMDGIAVKEPYDVERALSKLKPKDKTKVKVQRERATQEITATLEELPRLDQLPPGII